MTEIESRLLGYGESWNVAILILNRPNNWQLYSWRKRRLQKIRSPICVKISRIICLPRDLLSCIISCSLPVFPLWKIVCGQFSYPMPRKLSAECTLQGSFTTIYELNWIRDFFDHFRFVVILSNSIEARPISYSGGSTLMGFSDNLMDLCVYSFIHSFT